MEASLLGGKKIITLTEAQYDALSNEAKAADVMYYITDDTTSTGDGSYYTKVEVDDLLDDKQDKITVVGALYGNGSIVEAKPSIPTVTITKAAYDALSASEKAKDIIYNITDDESDENYQPLITASGVLQGNGGGGITAKVVDNTPTANSSNLVTSGGVADAISDVTLDTRFTVVGATGETYAQLFTRLFSMLDTTNRSKMCVAGHLMVGTTRFNVNEYSANMSNIWLSRIAVQSLKPLIEQVRLSATASTYYNILDGTSTDLSENSAAGITVKAVFPLT